MAGRSRSRMSVFVLLIVALVGWSDRSLSSEDMKFPHMWDGPTLHVLWNDAYSLFPVTGFDAMREEVEGIFAENGISVRVHRPKPGQSLVEFPEPCVNAVVVPAEAESWNLGMDTMAAAIGERGQKQTIFIFYPGVKRTLGHGTFNTSPARTRELTRAMGRIVAHELVHVLAPERGHADDGLMAPQLSRRVLVKKDIALDAESRNVARGSIEALAASIARVADTEGVHATN